MVAVGRGVVAAATVVVLVDVGVVVVAAGALDVDGARGIAVLEVEAAVVDEGAVGGGGGGRVRSGRGARSCRRIRAGRIGRAVRAARGDADQAGGEDGDTDVASELMSPAGRAVGRRACVGAVHGCLLPGGRRWMLSDWRCPSPCRHARAKGSRSASVALPQIHETTDGRGARPSSFSGWRGSMWRGCRWGRAVGCAQWRWADRRSVGVEDDEICCCVGAVVDDADEPAAVLASGSCGVGDELELGRLVVRSDGVAGSLAGDEVVAVDAVCRTGPQVALRAGEDARVAVREGQRGVIDDLVLDGRRPRVQGPTLERRARGVDDDATRVVVGAGESAGAALDGGPHHRCFHGWQIAG